MQLPVGPARAPNRMQTRRAKVRPRHDADGRRRDAPEESRYSAAMLRLALELKKPGAPPFERLVSELSREMQLHEPTFRRFLAQQGELFTALATGDR
jgi:hypothetical protein